MKCYLTHDVALKMKYYVESVDAEISGVGKTRMIDEDIIVEDIIIFKQKCTGSHTDLDVEDEAKIMYERDKRGESSKDWNLWWHSHNNMDVFWSGTDEDNIRKQAGNGNYLLSIVTNNDRKYKTRFDIFPKDVSPLKIKTHYKVEDDIETIVLPKDSKKFFELQDKIKELENKIEKKEDKLLEKYTKEIEDIEERVDNFEYIVEQLNNVKEKLEKQMEKESEKIETKLKEDKEKLEEKIDKIKEQEPIDNKKVKENIEKEVKDKVEVDDKSFELNDYKEYYQNTIDIYGDKFNKDDISDKIENIKDSAYYDVDDTNEQDMYYDKFYYEKYNLK